MRSHSLDLNPRLGFDNIRTLAGVAEPVKRRFADEALLPGMSPDSVKEALKGSPTTPSAPAGTSGSPGGRRSARTRRVFRGVLVLELGPGLHVRIVDLDRRPPSRSGDVPEDRLQGLHVRCAAAQVSDRVLDVVALHVHDHNIGELQDPLLVGCHEGLFVEDAALYDALDLGTLGLDKGPSPVKVRDLPVAAGAGALHGEHQLSLPALQVFRIRPDCGHDRSHEPHPQNHTTSRPEERAL